MILSEANKLNPQELLVENIKLVYHVVNKRIHPKSDYYQDAFQEASIAFLEAVDKYDSKKYKNIKFSSYVWTRMDWALLDFFREGRGHGLISDKQKSSKTREISWDTAKSDGVSIESVISEDKFSPVKMLREERWKNIYEALKTHRNKFNDLQWNVLIWNYGFEKPPFEFESRDGLPSLKDIGKYVKRSRQRLDIIKREINRIIWNIPEIINSIVDFEETLEN